MSGQTFTTSQVSDITGLTKRQLDHWARCGLFEPSIQKSSGPGTHKIYSIEDLVQLRSLVKLKCYHWSTQKIRKAIFMLREVMNDPHPLKRSMLVADKHTMIAICKTQEGERLLMDALASGGQQVLGVVLEVLEEDIRQIILMF